MRESQSLYNPEDQKQRILLTDQQKEAVSSITMGIEVVDAEVRTMAIGDIINTLENGHPLNRIITGKDSQVVGYIACEDFVPHEAYIKYFGTTGIEQTGLNPRQEIASFLDYAKQQGYTKINFHGWNDRLNHILERYGFKRLRTDNMADFSVDFYEKSLVEEKSLAQVSQERVKAFEQKYINELNRQYREIVAGFPQKAKNEKEAMVAGTFEALNQRLSAGSGFNWGDRQKAVLKLKLARHFQQNQTCDVNVLYDAIIESPKFINTDKGSLHRLFEVHEEKTLQKIAEIRKRRAEISGNQGFNPYENLFTTASGKYYVARLLNMPHLEEESEYMKHCVGTSDSYVNQIKRGDIEILSFRNAPKIDPATQRLEGDTPLMTWEYNLKTGVIEQMKKYDDEYLKPEDPYFNDVVDALKKLRLTTTDTGQPRNFSKISSSELENIKVKDYCVLTENWEVGFRDFNPDGSVFALKVGSMELTPNMTAEDAVKIVKIQTGINCKPEQLARAEQDITENTKVYVGAITENIIQKNIEHIFSSLQSPEIKKFNIEIGGKTGEQLEAELKQAGINISDYARYMMFSDDFKKSLLENPEEVDPAKQILKKAEYVDVVRLTVADLGFNGNATTEQIFNRAEQLGLELCPPAVGPHYRLQYKDQSMNEWLRIAMKQISDRNGRPSVFDLGHDASGLRLDDSWARPTIKWDPDDEFVFRLRKSKT